MDPHLPYISFIDKPHLPYISFIDEPDLFPMPNTISALNTPQEYPVPAIKNSAIINSSNKVSRDSPFESHYHSTEDLSHSQQPSGGFSDSEPVIKYCLSLAFPAPHFGLYNLWEIFIRSEPSYLQHYTHILERQPHLCHSMSCSLVNLCTTSL